MTYTRLNNKLVPERIIRAAVNGNIEALQSVLQHYDRYMCKLSLRRAFDENGTEYNIVDQEIKGRLQSKLIQYILRFKLAS